MNDTAKHTVNTQWGAKIWGGPRDEGVGVQVDTCPGSEGVRTRDSARKVPERARTDARPCAKQPHQKRIGFSGSQKPLPGPQTPQAPAGGRVAAGSVRAQRARTGASTLAARSLVRRGSLEIGALGEALPSLNKKLQSYGFFRDENWREESSSDAIELACAVASLNGGRSRRYHTRESVGSFTGAATSDNFKKVTNRCRRGFAATLRNVLNVNQGFVVSSENTKSQESLLSLKEAAARLAVCRRTLERLIASGEFPQTVKIGRAARVLESDVSSFITRLSSAREGRAAS